MINYLRSFLLCLLCLFTACGPKNNDGPENVRINKDVDGTPVETMTLERRDFIRELHANGRLYAVRRTSLSFPASGKILSSRIRNGQEIRSGDTLALLDRPDLLFALENAKVEMSRAEIQLMDNLANLGYSVLDTAQVPDRQMQSAKIQSGFTAAQIALKKARYNYEGTVLKAPFSGKIADLTQDLYFYSGSEPFCTLLDDSSFEVVFHVMESELSIVSLGDRVRITAFSDDTCHATGKICAINPTVDANGLIKVNARVKGVKGMVDRMSVKVVIDKKIPGQFVVPRSAVVIRDYMNVLFKCSEDGRALWTYVDILYSNADSHAVVMAEGRNGSLSEGDRIIVNGNMNLADGSKVSEKR